MRNFRSEGGIPALLTSLPQYFQEQGEGYGPGKPYFDVVLHTSHSKTFHCHSIVLASALNPYFRHLLTIGFRRNEGLIHLILPDFSSTDTEVFLKFIYGVDKTDLRGENVWHAYLTSSMDCTRVKYEHKEEESFGHSFDDDFPVYDRSVLHSYDALSGDEDEYQYQYHMDPFRVKLEEDPAENEAEGKRKPLVIGLRNVKPKKWNCPVEDCKFVADFSDLVKHVKDKHKTTVSMKLSCERCAESFKLKEDLLNHMHGKYQCRAVRDGSKLKYSCQECPVKFVAFRNLESHVHMHHHVSEVTLRNTWAFFLCEVCWRYFNSADKCLEHLLTSHNLNSGNFNYEIQRVAEEYTHKSMIDMGEIKDEQFQVDPHLPSKKYSQDWSVEQAENREDQMSTGNQSGEMDKDNKFACQICSRTFKSRHGFTDHLEKHHSTDSSFICQFCGDKLPTKFAKINHLKTCSKTFPCDECGQKFRNPIGVKNHKSRAHMDRVNHVIHEKIIVDGKTRYKCDLCQKDFPSNRNVRQHKLGVHSSLDMPKKYVCKKEGCKYKTNVHSNFQEHCQTHGPAKHICDQCGDSFTSLYSMKQHVTRIHSSDNILCDVCPKTFTNVLSLKMHRKTHGEKRFKCHICEKTFMTSGNLKHHILSHSDERPFPCHLCQKAFKTKDKVTRHLKTHVGKS